jgi:hypothetical protein
LFTAPVLKGIAAGRITLAFRRWTTCRARPGARHRTPIGLVEIVAVSEARTITAADARKAGYRDVEALRRELDAWPGTAWRIQLRPAGADPRLALRRRTSIRKEEVGRLSRDLPLLRLLARRPGVRAGDLAREIGRPKEKLKRDVRALKELGLTESLGTGYRVSPRGRALLKRTKARQA